jgi:hypothetical protein
MPSVLDTASLERSPWQGVKGQVGDKEEEAHDAAGTKTVWRVHARRNQVTMKNG